MTAGKTGLDSNVTATAILDFIIESKGSTAYKIGKALKIPSSKVGYHLQFFEESGLVLSDMVDDVKIYIPQPVLVDEVFSTIVDQALNTIYAAAGKVPDKVCAKSGKVEDIEAVLENCIRAKVILALLQ